MADRQISDAALDILFRKARSHGVFEPGLGFRCAAARDP